MDIGWYFTPVSDGDSNLQQPPFFGLSYATTGTACRPRALAPTGSTSVSFDQSEPMGSGSESEVFFGQLRRPLVPARHVAVKRVATRNEQRRRHIEAELKMFQGAQHPALVSYLEHSMDEQFVYVVMEVARMNLVQWLETKPSLSDHLLRELSRQLLAGLEYLHCGGIVIGDAKHPVAHRDLKPHNVLVFNTAANGVCLKLCDFGLAKQWIADVEQSKSVTNSTVGTMGYVAPDQMMMVVGAGEKNRDLLKNDIWSMGAVLGFLHLRGRHPYQLANETPMTIMLNVALGRRFPWTEAKPEVNGRGMSALE
jgi:serine/threonine protein kinase